MKIVINGWFVGRRDAGCGQYIDHLLVHLAQSDRSHRLLLLVPESTAVLAPPGVEEIRLPLPRLPRQLAKLYWEQITVPRAAARLDGDVLWIPYWAAPWWQPCPVAVTVHDLIPQLLPAYRGGRLQRLYTRLVGVTARRASQVIAVSEAGRRDIIARLNIPAARVHVVHHGPNQEDVPPPTAAELALVRTRYRLPDRFFLYLGGFDLRKNVPGILRAYAGYLAQGGDPAVRLVIAGKLPEVSTQLKPDPRVVAAELGLNELVHFCGWVDETEKPALYALATAFLFPSLYEGFGMMLLEAMAAAAPVITSDR